MSTKQTLWSVFRLQHIPEGCRRLSKYSLTDTMLYGAYAKPGYGDIAPMFYDQSINQSINQEVLRWPK